MSLYIVEDWYNHQISKLLQKKTTKTKQWTNQVRNNKKAYTGENKPN